MIRPNINPNVIRSKAFDAEFKAASDASGTFSGYGSVFGVVDSYGEIVAPGAFKESLAEFKSSGRSVPVLWQHQSSNPIGNWLALKEDDRGLLGDAQLWLDEAPQAKLAYKGLQTKAITGLSIGYYVKKYEVNEEDETVLLTDLNLVEISVVTSPANDEARVEAVKAKLDRGERLLKSEVERILREAGISRKMATAIVARGMQDEDQSDSDDVAPAVLKALGSFSLR